MLTKNQFDVLTFLEKEKRQPTQRELAKKLGISLGTVNRALNELEESDFLRVGHVTEEGLAALEPHRVKRAIILAAGFGSRLVPITLNTPKPLVRVKGKRIIDSLLDALLAAGIEEIHIVRGYLGEQFDQLLYKYPSLQFHENPDYKEANSISSAMCIRHMTANAYMCDADILLRNPGLITKYQYQTNYLGVPVQKTDDWCLKTKNGYIAQMVLGGTGCYHMFGISYWDEKDGTFLEQDIESVYQAPGGKERYWDQVPLEFCKKHYQVTVRPCTFYDIIEIDTYRELKQLDDSYDNIV